MISATDERAITTVKQEVTVESETLYPIPNSDDEENARKVKKLNTSSEPCTT